jgi:hypothetical protein
MSLTFNDYKPTNWNLAGKLGGNAFGASGIVVNTTNVNAQSDVNMNAELTGEVRVRFRSDYFPLERFADSGAIQLINSHARVPDPRRQEAPAAPGAAPAEQALPYPPPLPGGDIGMPPAAPSVPGAPAAPSAPGSAPATSAQGLPPNGSRR